MRGHRGILQKQRTLEKLPAVQSASQNEVAVQQRAGFLEEGEDFVHSGGFYILWALTHATNPSTPPP